ncbi:MAG: succinyldiaminopimelate transaminase [Acidimicrobiia bacterium]|nr:succinyldiaminopimelate transaminase [Acidimicrobiia bacterium]
MNTRLADLQPYPFEKLRALFSGVTPPVLSPIRLSIGEPQHATPSFIGQALVERLSGLSTYPTTAGTDVLRSALCEWFARRYHVRLDPATQVLPVNGTREALFSFAQTVVDAQAHRDRAPLVACPNPFYQIYEGAAVLAGAQTAFLNQTADADYCLALDALSEEEWRRTQLLYVCTPGNPTGRVLRLEEWAQLFEYADRYGFTIASDECYADIYPNEREPPLGGLEAAARLGRVDFRGLVVFVSLSKRSNAPGLRSGAVAGDAVLLERYLLYRTYHGCAMSLAVQHASVAAWREELHVRQNRGYYREKFEAVVPILAPVLDVSPPEAGFYLWARVPGSDTDFARELFAATHVTVLPGQFLARDAHGLNPGVGYVRIALVPELTDCVEAARRIAHFTAES